LTLRRESNRRIEKSHNQELGNLYCLPNIMVINLRIRWVGHAARVSEMNIYIKYYSKNLKGRGNLENVGVNWRIILKCKL